MMKRLIALAFLLCPFAGAQTSVTVTRADGTVLNGPGGSVTTATPVPLGIGMGCYGVYGSCQLTKNLLAGNGNDGAEPLQSTIVWVQPAAGTGTYGTAGANTWSTQTMYVGGGQTAQMQAQWVGGTDTIVTSSISGHVGCAQTISNVTIAGAENTETTASIASAGTCGGTQAGDVHVLTGVMQTGANGASIAAANLNSVSVYLGGTGATATFDTATPLDGLRSYRLNSLAAGSEAVLLNGFDTGVLADRFVSVDGTYTFSALVRLNSGATTFSVQVQRAESSGPAAANCTISSLPLTTTPTVVSGTCTATENTTRPNPGPVSVNVIGVGNDFDIDDVSFAKTSGQDSTNTSVFRDEYVDALKTQWYAGKRNAPFRFGPEIQNGETYANWAGTTDFSAHQTGFSIFGAASAHPRLPDYLKLVGVLGATPYVHLPANVTVADAVSYLRYASSTNASDAEVILRTSQGHAAPYCGPTGDFTVCYFSLANEAWNTAEGVNGGNFQRGPSDADSYTRYMARQGQVWAAIRGATAFPGSAYVKLISNAQYQNFSGWTTELAAMPTNGRPDGAELSPYVSVYFSSSSTPEALWRGGLNTPHGQINNSSSSFAVVVNSIRAQNQCGQSGTAQCQVYIYEQGPNDLVSCGFTGYPSCQPSGTALVDQTHLQVMDVGAGQGIITADEYLENLSNGIVAQNVFASNEFGGDGDNANATGSGLHNYQDYAWGVAVDYGGATATLDGAYARARPEMLAAQVVNTGIIGPQVSCSNNGGTYSAPANPGYSSIYPAMTMPTLSTKCFADGAGNYSIVVVNRSTTQAFALAVAGTNSSLGSTTITQFAPSSLNTVNEATAIVPTSSVVAAPTYNAAANLSNASSSPTSPTSIAIPVNSVTTIVYSLTGSGVTWRQVI